MRSFLKFTGVFISIVGVQLSVSGVAVGTTALLISFDRPLYTFVDSQTRLSRNLTTNYDKGSGQGNDGPGTSQGAGTR